MNQPCDHFASLGNHKVPGNPQCAECVKIGASWVHLRTCQACGVTLCCDSSQHKHMTAHINNTSHALVISAEPGEKWAYCYTHKIMAPYL